MSSAPLRWRLADDDGGQPSLLPDTETPGRRALREVEYLHVRAKRIITRVPAASRMPFPYTINVYRGCAHACTYCFARPTHAYLDLDPGRDFEERIVVKVNAAERVRAELRAPSWGGGHIAMGTNTDPYQPAEGRYGLTRAVCEELVAARNPFSILTKSPMIVRDVEVLAEAARRGEFRAALSIGSLDPEVAQLAEPGAPPPRRRLEAVSRLVEAGIPCGVMVAPVLPGLSDDPAAVRAVVTAALEAGADGVSAGLLHLRTGVRELYLDWLREARPALVADHEARYPVGRAYAPRAEQEALARVVRGAVDAYRQRRRGDAAASGVRVGTVRLAPRRAPVTGAGRSTPTPPWPTARQPRLELDGTSALEPDPRRSPARPGRRADELPLA